MDFHFFFSFFFFLSIFISLVYLLGQVWIQKAHSRERKDWRSLLCEMNRSDCTLSIFEGYRIFPLSFNFRVKQETKEKYPARKIWGWNCLSQMNTFWSFRPPASLGPHSSTWLTNYPWSEDFPPGSSLPLSLPPTLRPAFPPGPLSWQED